MISLYLQSYNFCRNERSFKKEQEKGNCNQNHISLHFSESFSTSFSLDKVFKNEPSKICGRQSFLKAVFTNFTWVILEYFGPVTVISLSHWNTKNVFCTGETGTKIQICGKELDFFHYLNRVKLHEFWFCTEPFSDNYNIDIFYGKELASFSLK